MKIKHLTILTLVFALMVAMVGAVAAQDDTDTDGRRGKGGFGRGFGDSTIVTDATGLTQEELRDAVRNGSTVAELIEANGGNVDTVIAALIAEATNNITEKVESGDITQDRADTKLETLEERITARVNGTFERPTDADGRRDGRRGRRGFDGDNTDDATETTDADTTADA